MAAIEVYVMTVESTRVKAIEKPWGKWDLAPWSDIRPNDAPIGEVWFQRRHPKAESPELLLKLLFTTEPLSIQVHPDDAFARSLGLKNGKTEAWYILEAAPGARVAAGLKRSVTTSELRASIEDGSIQDLVKWRDVSKGDVIVIPAGVIHAIGAGIVIAEIQQRSDSTFRLFDFGRGRSLDIESGMAVAIAKPIGLQHAARSLTSIRTLHFSCSQFVLESIELSPHANIKLRGTRETWILITKGQARFGALEGLVGNAVFVERDVVEIEAGDRGLRALVAYTGPDPILDLLNEPTRTRRERTQRSEPPTLAPPPKMAEPLAQSGKAHA